MPYLLVFENNRRGIQQIPLESNMILFGRNGSVADVKLDDKTVSRSHAYIKFINGHWFIEDAGSRAGTFLDGQRIKLPCLLRNLSTIQLGDVTMEFHSTDEDVTQTAEETLVINALELRLQMSFRPMPKAIRIQYRQFSIKPEEIFEKGDTVLAGNGGIRTALPKGIEADSVIELSITSPNHKPRTFLGEVVGVFKGSLPAQMFIKLHLPEDPDVLERIYKDCRRSPWAILQEGSVTNNNQSPRAVSKP